MNPVDDSITIESATMTEAEMTAALGGTVSAPDEAVLEPPSTTSPPTTDTTSEPPTATTEPAAVTPQVDIRSEFERKVDELDPPLPNETKDQRAVRMSRGEKRILGLLSRTKATEDQLTEARAELARLKATSSTITPPPAGSAPAITEAPKPEIAPFSFQAWDQYSEQHPEASHEDYLDARSDAREAWKTTKARIEYDHAERERVMRDVRAAQKASDEETHSYVEVFRTAHPEYDDAMRSAMDLPLTPAMNHTMREYRTLGPAIALHLAQHRDDAVHIATLPWHEQVGEIRDIAKSLKAGQPPTPLAEAGAIPPPAPATRATVTPPAATPSRPLSDAPAPTSVVHGSAQPTRSLAAIADADEDADAYIIERQRQRREIGLRR